MIKATLPSNVPTLFDRQRVLHNRKRAAAGLMRHSVLLDDAGAELADRLSAVKRHFSRILDLGSRQLNLSRLLLKGDTSRFIVHVPAADIRGSIGISTARA